MIEGTEMEKDDCTTIVLKAHKAGNQPLFNNAAQVIIVGVLLAPSNLFLIRQSRISLLDPFSVLRATCLLLLSWC
jgi:hypothetical protein